MVVLDLQKVTNDIQNFLFDVLQESGLQKMVIGLSGGVDSSLSATLASSILGKDQLHIVMLPYGNLHSESLADAKLLVEHLQIPSSQVSVIDIQPAVDAVASTLYGINEVRKGNIMARVRMIYLFDLAKKLQAMVLGTENRTEHFLGYFTRFGDEASDIEPIRSLYKTQVWELASFLGVPEAIVTKAPTAGLWDGQTDEGELGFSYKEADVVLYYYIDEKLTLEQIVAKGMNLELVTKVIERVEQNRFKHELPKVFK